MLSHLPHSKNPLEFERKAESDILLCENSDVLLIVPPFADSSIPALGPSLLMAGCIKRNINCHILYANLSFASMIGYDQYQKISRPNKLLYGETLFAPYFTALDKNELRNSLLAYRSSLEKIGFGIEDSLNDEYLKCDLLIQTFIDYTVSEIIKFKPSIVGFSSTFEQNMPSLAIVKRLKEISPEIIIVIGGSNMTQPMGKALSDIVPLIDYVFSGEADIEFPLFCENYLHNGALPTSKIINCTAINDMELIDIPNYDDYFQQLSKKQQEGLLPAEWPTWITYESSRGCWWGSKCPCAYCGLNTINMKYRQKSNKRILNEIVSLKHK